MTSRRNAVGYFAGRPIRDSLLWVLPRGGCPSTRGNSKPSSFFRAISTSRTTMTSGARPTCGGRSAIECILEVIEHGLGEELGILNVVALNDESLGVDQVGYAAGVLGGEVVHHPEREGDRVLDI